MEQRRSVFNWGVGWDFLCFFFPLFTLDMYMDKQITVSFHHGSSLVWSTINAYNSLIWKYFGMK